MGKLLHHVRLHWVPPIILAGLLLVVMVGCDALSAALPPTPSPFPTLPRLPSVTPEPPSPTPAPTFTPHPTSTPVLLTAIASLDANVRNGPGLSYDIINRVPQGQAVILQSRGSDDAGSPWYQITTQDGEEGWMAEEVLTLDPATVNRVPTIAAGN